MINITRATVTATAILMTAAATAGCSGMINTVVDPSCTTAAENARPRVEEFARGLPETTEFVARTEGCSDGGQATLRFRSAETPQALGQRLVQQGCTLQQGKESTWTCTLDTIEFSLRATDDKGGSNALATITAT